MASTCRTLPLSGGGESTHSRVSLAAQVQQPQSWAAVPLTDSREKPTISNAVSFTFSPHQEALCSLQEASLMPPGASASTPELSEALVPLSSLKGLYVCLQVVELLIQLRSWTFPRAFRKDSYDRFPGQALSQGVVSQTKWGGDQPSQLQRGEAHVVMWS